MILLPLRDKEKGVTHMIIVLEDDNLSRIKKHDNAEIIWTDVCPNEKPGNIAIAYASPAEMRQITQWAARGENDKAVKLLTGGWQFRPDLGDHDRGPEPLVKPS